MSNSELTVNKLFLFKSTRSHTTEAFHELNGTASSPRRAAEHTIWDDVVENIDDVFVDKFEKKNKPSVLFV
jgi:hypothetical protein